jgi:poly(A) polymerase
VTNLIEQLVPNFESFLKLVRCVRLWAKRRGLYSNKMGYLGGVNCNILAAFTCQLYPNAAPSTLLKKFFEVYKDWDWNTPIALTHLYDAQLGYEIWDRSYGSNRFHVMPILTPAYPSMNSTVSVSYNTLEVMQEEIATAFDAVLAVLARDGQGWDEVFAPSDFAVAHSRYLAAEVYVQGVPEHLSGELLRSWSGYVESRLRKLVEHLSYLPVSRLRLMPKKLPLLTVRDAQGGEGIAYLIGFDIDKDRMQGGELHLTNKVDGYKQELYSLAHRHGVLPEGMTHKNLRVRVTDFSSWRKLPDAALESLGGREAAKQVRKRFTERRKAIEATLEQAVPSADHEAAAEAHAGEKRPPTDGPEEAMPSKVARAEGADTEAPDGGEEDEIIG